MPSSSQDAAEFLAALNFHVAGLELSGDGLHAYMQHMGVTVDAPGDSQMLLYLTFKHSFGLTYMRMTPMRISSLGYELPDYAVLIIQTLGSSTIRDLATGEDVTLEGGQALLIPTSHPYEHSCSGVSGVVGVWISYRAIGVSSRSRSVLMTAHESVAALNILSDMAMSFLRNTPSPTRNDIDHIRASIEHLTKWAFKVNQRVLPPESVSDESLFDRARRVIEGNADDPLFTVDTLAQTLSRSPVTVRRLFRQYGVTPLEEITRARLEILERVQRDSEGTLTKSELAARAGFSSASAMRRAVSRANDTTTQ